MFQFHSNFMSTFCKQTMETLKRGVYSDSICDAHIFHLFLDSGAVPADWKKVQISLYSKRRR